MRADYALMNAAAAEAPTEADTPALWRLWQEAFGDGEAFLRCFWRTAFSPARCRLVRAGEEIAAALYWFDCQCENERMAYIYAVATAEAHRGRGLCHRLMEETHRHLTESGYTGALLVPGSRELFAFYGRMGYRACGYVREISAAPAERAVAVRETNPRHYAAKRRALLPSGGVIQENENLPFLEAQARLFEGEGFVLAARREGDSLFGLELLGDAAVAGGVLTALGCARGRFRIPARVGEALPTDGDKPFAMYLPLKRGATVPTYFGIAFD